MKRKHRCLLRINRYAIADASEDWTVAEAQVGNLGGGKGAGKSTIVSVKTAAAPTQKRKAEETDAGPKFEKKKARRSLKKDKQR